MSRQLSILITVLAVLLVPVSASADDLDGAEVDHRTHLCSVGWGDGDFIDPACEIINVSQPNGGYTLVLHGQVPDLAAFQASGVRHFETTCFVAYLFVVFHSHPSVGLVDSVRHFTPDGKMTETCQFTPTA